MSCTSSSGFYQWADQVPISFSEWKSILAKLNKEEALKRLSTASDRSQRSTSRNYSSTKSKQERQVLSRNQAFNGSVVDSYLPSSSATANPPSLIITRQDIPKIVSTPKKRYVSSFRTLVNSTNDKHTQRLNYIRDSVMILKLSKDKQLANVNSEQQSGPTGTQFSSKQSIISMSTTTNHTSTSPKQQDASSSSSVPTQLSPILKVEGQRRRTAAVHHDLPQTPSSHTDVSITAIPSLNIAMNTTNQSSQSTSLSNYRNAISSSNISRQRTIMDASSNGLLFSTERIKSNISLTVRPTRPSLTTTSTTMSSAYYSSQQAQRQNLNQAKSRLQQDRIATTRESYDYPDPFANCPPELLNKLAQLTKLQLETIEWERKRRFTKKKPTTTNTSSSIIQGKDSP